MSCRLTGGDDGRLGEVRAVVGENCVDPIRDRHGEAAQKVRGFIASMDAANADHERRVAAIREQLTADHAEERALQRLVDKLRFGK